MSEPQPERVPEDLSGHLDANSDAMRTLLVAATHADPAARLRVTRLLIERVIDAVRRATLDALIEQAEVVHEVLAGPAGARLRETEPAAAGAWAALADTLLATARRRDSGSTGMIVRTHKKWTRRILELLGADPSTPMLRTTLREQLGIESSNLSHVLRDLEEADVVVRCRDGRSVLVTLGGRGMDLAREWGLLVEDKDRLSRKKQAFVKAERTANLVFERLDALDPSERGWAVPTFDGSDS